MEYLVIYLIGFLLSYILGRKIIRLQRGEYYGFNDSGSIFIVSLFSYMGVVIFGFMLIGNYMKNYKPPKFL